MHIIYCESGTFVYDRIIVYVGTSLDLFPEYEIFTLFQYISNSSSVHDMAVAKLRLFLQDNEYDSEAIEDDMTFETSSNIQQVDDLIYQCLQQYFYLSTCMFLCCFSDFDNAATC